MVKVGISGFGRIGRLALRRILTLPGKRCPELLGVKRM